MKLENKISYLESAIIFNTAHDIWELPRLEFAKEVAMCKATKAIPNAAYPFVVLYILEQERSTFLYKIKKLIKLES